jgi:DNA-binding XRE family transcriptional regulator
LEREGSGKCFYNKIIYRKEKKEMNERCKGVLKMFRERAGYTQEEAASELNLSIHTLSNYETYSLEVRRHLPPEETVLQMAELYKSDYLKILFLNETNLIFRSIFSNIELLDLPMAFINYQVEHEDVHELEGGMRKVILDNEIDEHESEIAGSFLKELMESAMASMSLAFSTLEKTPPKLTNATKRTKVNERRIARREADQFQIWG